MNALDFTAITRPAEPSSATATSDVDPMETRAMTHENAGYMLAGG